MKAKIAPLTMPLRICGSVTRKKVATGPAPRSAEASSRLRWSSVSWGSTARSTKGTMITTWPTSSALKLRVRPMAAPYWSSAAPSTTCGRISGDIRMAEIVRWPGKAYRAIASAAGTAMRMARAVATAASSVLVAKAET